MHPCEQCVFIRYGNLVIALGAIIAMINPKAVLLKLAGYVVSIYGLIYTTLSAVHLAKMHHAVHSDDMDDLFGMQGCSSEPAFPFGLPLDKWAQVGLNQRATAVTMRRLCRVGRNFLIFRPTLFTSTNLRMVGISFLSGNSWIRRHAAS